MKIVPTDYCLLCCIARIIGGAVCLRHQMVHNGA